MLTEQQSIEIVRENKGGTLQGYNYQSTFGDVTIWEIWTLKSDEFHIRFVLGNDANSAKYFGDFQSLCQYLDTLRGDAGLQAARQKISSFAFILSLFALWALIFYLAVTQTVDSKLYIIVGGLFSSACTYFFGRSTKK